jgi:secreted trypsin-like serine protease
MRWLLIVAAIFQIACARQNVTRHNSSLRSNSNLFQENGARTPRIVGGSDAQVGRYPYMVSLLSRSGFYTCGGVLVAKDLVLTVAHCR